MARKKLRLITRNNMANYFLWRGELMGFEYELARQFADKHGLRLEVIVAPSHKAMLEYLLKGMGDIAAGFLTPTEHRKAMKVAFSRPYHYTSEILVARSDDDINSTEDLNGRTVSVRASSSYWQSLLKLRAQGLDIQMEPAPETEETEEIITKVASGEYQLTIADSHLLDLELTSRDDIKAVSPIGDQVAQGWAVRQSNPQLLAQINRFFKKFYRSLNYNLAYKKYFKSPRTINARKRQYLQTLQEGVLSPYDDLIRKYATQYDFDWRLIAAQVYRESHFNTQAKSWAGARGLMQVMPRTAREMGFTDLYNPEIGLHAGVRYLDWVRKRFSQDLPITDRMWFTLAAYNAGTGHVRDARRLAKQKGWDPNRWFDNVEKAILLLSKRQYARQARHGYLRGTEPVHYVREIRDYYRAYVQLTANSSRG